jgi:hypothetical protein
MSRSDLAANIVSSMRLPHCSKGSQEAAVQVRRAIRVLAKLGFSGPAIAAGIERRLGPVAEAFGPNRAAGMERFAALIREELEAVK